MNTTSFSPVVVLAAVLLAVGPRTEPIAAQSGAERVIVAIPETFPVDEARTVILREPHRDIVLLRASDATVDALAMSLIVLSEKRKEPLEPGTGQMIPITGFVLTTPVPDEDRRRLEGILARLQRQPVTAVGNFGPGRWIRYRAR